MRVLVTGSRDWPSQYLVVSVLNEIRTSTTPEEPLVIVHGACPTGADHFASAWVEAIHHWDRNLTEEPHPADWGRYGNAAGPIRNSEMVALGADQCLAFIKNESRGATDCANKAEAAGIPTRRFTA